MMKSEKIEWREVTHSYGNPITEYKNTQRRRRGSGDLLFIVVCGRGKEVPYVFPQELTQSPNTGTHTKGEEGV